MTINNFPLKKFEVPVSIAFATDAKLSSAGDMGGTIISGLSCPAVINGTQATFEVSIDGVTFTGLLDPDTGADYIVPIVASKSVPLKTTYFLPFRFVKVKTVTDQTANRVFKLASML